MVVLSFIFSTIFKQKALLLCGRISVRNITQLFQVENEIDCKRETNQML